MCCFFFFFFRLYPTKAHGSSRLIVKNVEEIQVVLFVVQNPVDICEQGQTHRVLFFLPLEGSSSALIDKQKNLMLVCILKL